MSAGIRSYCMPWLGGASAPSTATGGVRSMCMPWLGGACAPSTAQAGGIRSLCLPWFGGVCAPVSTPTPPQPSPVSGGGAYYDWKRDLKPEFDDGEELMELMSMIAPYL